MGELSPRLDGRELGLGGKIDQDGRRYMVLVVEDEHEARKMASKFSDEACAVIKRTAKFCRESYPERTHCECFCCSIFRWLD